MSSFDLNEHSHTRLNILTGEWVLVSPHRSKRPWQGKIEDIQADERPSYDPTCYLCPGNQRAGGIQNPQYENTFVFNNDFAALQAETPTGGFDKKGLLKAQSESGICKVICFSPNHNLTLPEMEIEDITKVIDLWCSEYKSLGERPDINYVQIFENKGELMGCSNPHPHGQIWSQRNIPLEVSKESKQQKEYFEKTGKSLLSDYLEIELEDRQRIVTENVDFAVLVPFWAVWPYETIVISKSHHTDILKMSASERTSLAEIINRITIKYDNLFKISFPYSAGIHQRPTDGQEHPEWHLHMHFYPPLLRSASIRKFMVGYEMMANPQRDITPEWSAQRLRDLDDVHYKKKVIVEANK